MKKRTIYQIVSLLALHSSWGPEAKWLCNPVLSCHSCVLSWFACPIGVFVHYSGWHLFPWIAAGTVLLVGALVGRLLCGWVCPFGFVQDLLHKIPSPKISLPKWTSNIKYLVLVMMVFALPFLLGEQTWFSFCRICPAAALQVSMPAAIGSGFDLTGPMVVRFSVLFGVIVLVILSSRAFCKVLCPIGALMSPLNYVSYWFVGLPREQCRVCKSCDKVCSTDDVPSERIRNNVPPNRSLDCIVCHECKHACEEATARQAENGAAG